MEDEALIPDGHDHEVPEHPYYVINPQPMAGHNLVLSIIPSEQVCHQIVELSDRVPQAFYLNPVRYDHIHVTVTIVGGCLLHTVRKLDQALRAMPKPRSFRARGRGLRAFPCAQRPNYLVTEVRALDTAGRPVTAPAHCPFTDLFRRIKSVLAGLDLEITEHVPYNPHITVARNRLNDFVHAGNVHWLAKRAAFRTAQFFVDRFVLCGSGNTHLQTYPLLPMK